MIDYPISWCKSEKREMIFKRPLWEKYQKEAMELGIEIESCKCIRQERYSFLNYNFPSFEIFIKLKDLAGLPIDFEKVKKMTQEEAQELKEKRKNEKVSEKIKLKPSESVEYSEW